jgi:hypothetical protein
MLEALCRELSAFDSCMAQLSADARRHALGACVERIVWDGKAAAVVWKNAAMTG